MPRHDNHARRLDDQLDLEALIERSSLGSTAARNLRARTSPLEAADAIEKSRSTAELKGFLRRHDAELQQRALVIGHVYGLDPAELFGSTRAQFWLRRDELNGLDDDDRLAVLRMLLARRARELARYSHRSDEPSPRTAREETALTEVADHTPTWRNPEPSVLATPETRVFWAMTRMTPTIARDVLVLCWLGIAADDIADELRVATRTLNGLISDASTQVRRLLADTPVSNTTPPVRRTGPDQ